MNGCEEDEGNIQHDLEVENSNIDAESTELKRQAAVSVSIDVTKALLLLGLPTWASLEPGK